ncbi:[protein-PII] uridylyltransferase [Methylococcus sp. EFPC2]|nr:[protein-PII] uridylyltransferase [Methylococcus sp. EFPC2]
MDSIRLDKAQIQAHTDELIRRFEADEGIENLIRAHADFMDELLKGAWRRRVSRLNGRPALIAVGGYGRRELHLHADIDLLVLIEERAPNQADQHEAYEQTLGAFFSHLWDIGLKPGHSVRTVSECVQAAHDDQTIMTNLLEARLIDGTPGLLSTLQARLAAERPWSSALFFEAKLAEQRLRYAKYHNTAYKLEPNIKEGPGGLRDIQIIGWIIKHHYNSADLRHLVAYGWLTEAEFAEFIDARNFLWKVRFALHALTGKCEDRLLFDNQEILAERFGYQAKTVNQAVEPFMQRYFRTVMGLERFNEMVLQLFKEVALGNPEEALITPINSGFQAVNQFIEVLHPAVFQERPAALIEIFLLLQQNTALQGIRATTIRLIRQSLPLIDENFRRNPEVCGLFMRILRKSTGITHVLRRMNRYGVLAAYLPEFARVVGRMQYDLFHVYTVDEHTLFVIRNLRRFALNRYRTEHPLCNEVFKLIEKPELLYIAGLMHDIGKGSGGDHSQVGAELAGEFCRRHGLGQRDTELVQWLVRQHLLMSITAQRKDISDPTVIHKFAEVVGDSNHLHHLYLLTVADICATNPTLWNAWKGALLRELFTSTRRAFRSGLEKPPDLDMRIRVNREEARSQLTRLGLSETTLGRVWETVSEDYFLRTQPDDITWHTVAIAATREDELPLVLLRPINQRGSAEIFIYARNVDFLFAHTTAVLDQLGLTVYDAKLITTINGYALNSYHVLENSGEPIKEQRRQIAICAKLRQALLNLDHEPTPVQRREDRLLRHFMVPTEIYFRDVPERSQTLLELIATDRPGLLSKVGLAFRRCQIRVHDARISTVGSRAEDFFLITDRQDRPLNAPEQRRQLHDALIELVGER